MFHGVDEERNQGSFLDRRCWCHIPRWITVIQARSLRSTRVASSLLNHVQDITSRFGPRVRPRRGGAVASAVPLLRQPGSGTTIVVVIVVGSSRRRRSRHSKRGAQVRPQQPDLRHPGLQRVTGRPSVTRHLSYNRPAKRRHWCPARVQQVRLSGKSAPLVYALENVRVSEPYFFAYLLFLRHFPSSCTLFSEIYFFYTRCRHCVFFCTWEKRSKYGWDWIYSHLDDS